MSKHKKRKQAKRAAHTILQRKKKKADIRVAALGAAFLDDNNELLAEPRSGKPLLKKFRENMKTLGYFDNGKRWKRQRG